MLTSDTRELLINAGDPCFEDADLLQQEPHHVPDGIRQHHGRIFDEGGNPGQRGSRPHADRQPVSPEQAPHRINASRTVSLPMTSHPMEREQRLLLEGLDRDGSDVATACRFEQRLGIRPVSLIAAHIRSHGLRGNSCTESARS
jgi:hypothetical protein